MKFEKGVRIRHPKMEDWGLGEVLEDSNGENVRAFFVVAGEKTLSLKHVQPVIVPVSQAAHPVLDNLKITSDASGIKYQSLPQSIEYFLTHFPQGFYGERFNDEEREYKMEAHALGQDLLGQNEFTKLVESGEFDEICKRALKLANKTNLIFPNEKMALKDGLVANTAKEEFAAQLHSLLYGNGQLGERFSTFAKMLESIDAAKWTTATYFLFILRPEQFMFVKPTITQHAASLCGFEIYYKPQLNWPTYQAVLKFSDYLRNELSELNPRDMIDVQSFMWCIAPSS